MLNVCLTNAPVIDLSVRIIIQHIMKICNFKSLAPNGLGLYFMRDNNADEWSVKEKKILPGPKMLVLPVVC